MRKRLAGRLTKKEVDDLCAVVKGDKQLMSELYTLTSDPDNRIAANALWTFTHLDRNSAAWLRSKREDLADRAMAEHDTTKLRLTLTLLLRLPYDKESLRTDFIDFCLAGVTARSYPNAIRALCLKLAYQQMRHHSELLQELAVTLDILTQEPLPPSLRSASNIVYKKLMAVLKLSGHANSVNNLSG